MNMHLTQPFVADRRRWTADDLRQMVVAGIVAEDERIELIAGEIVAMSPKGMHHEVLRIELVNYWADRKGALYKFADETPLRLDQHNEPEPDIVITRGPTDEYTDRHPGPGDLTIVIEEDD